MNHYRSNIDNNKISFDFFLILHNAYLHNYYLLIYLEYCLKLLIVSYLHFTISNRYFRSREIIFKEILRAFSRIYLLKATPFRIVSNKVNWKNLFDSNLKIN